MAAPLDNNSSQKHSSNLHKLDDSKHVSSGRKWSHSRLGNNEKSSCLDFKNVQKGYETDGEGSGSTPRNARIPRKRLWGTLGLSPRESSKGATASESRSPALKLSSDRSTGFVYRTSSADSPRNKQTVPKKQKSLEEVARKKEKSAENISVKTPYCNLKKRLMHEVEGSNFKPLNPKVVDDVFRGNIEAIYLKYMPFNKDYTFKDLNVIREKLSWKVLECFRSQHGPISLLLDRLSFLNIFLEKEKKGNQSKIAPWIEKFFGFLRAIEDSFCKGEEGQPLDVVLKKFRHDRFEKCFFIVFNKDRSVAKEVLKRIRFWRSAVAISEIRKEIDNLMDIRTILNRTFSWDCQIEVEQILTKCAYDQVARSYLESTSVNYEEIVINGIKLETTKLEGKVLQCQESFFRQFLSHLYKSGLSEKYDDEYITSQLKIFIEIVEAIQKGHEAIEALKEEKKDLKDGWAHFLGWEILYLGSILGWSVADQMLRKLYAPFCFSKDSKYVMRQKGMKCFVEVNRTDEVKNFTLSVARTCIVYESLNEGTHLAFSPRGEPLCSMDVEWSCSPKVAVPLDSVSFGDGWHSNLKITKLERGVASDIQWKDCENYLKTPVQDPRIEVAPCEDEDVQSVLDLLMM